MLRGGVASRMQTHTSPRFVELAVAPSVLASMLPVFVKLSRRIGKRRAWYAGLALYWAIWVRPSRYRSSGGVE